MLSGDPGAGKTWVALAIAAALSRGRAPFSGEALEPCTVLYASTQNAFSEVVRPRFAKLDGDASRLLLLRGVVSDPPEQPASLSLRDIPVLEDALRRTHARLLIVDPLHSYFGANVRPGRRNDVLDSLAMLADRHRCCILFVRHLSKRGGSRTTRSIELSGAVRTEFLAGSSPDAPSCSALLQVKSNLGPLAPALGYWIDDAGRFAWTGLSKLTPEEMLTDRPTGAGHPNVSSRPNGSARTCRMASAPNTALRWTLSATEFPLPPCGAANSISVSPAPKTQKLAHGIGLCLLQKKSGKVPRGQFDHWYACFFMQKFLSTFVKQRT